MGKPLFYHFRHLILASKIDQTIMFLLKPFLGPHFSKKKNIIIFIFIFQKWSILGPPSKSDGVNNGTQIDQVVQILRNFLFPGTASFQPCFHETIIITVPLGHRGF